jgi:hypothetical protein
MWKRAIGLAIVSVALTSVGCEGTPSPLCLYTLSLSGAPSISAGGARRINVTTDSACTWSFQSNDPWLTVGPDPDNTGGPPGTGNGALEVQIAANNGVRRVGTLTVAMQTITIDQAGSNGSECAFQVVPPTSTYTSGFATTGSFTVVPSDAKCGWTVTRGAVLEDTVTMTAGGSGSTDQRFGVGQAVIVYQVKADTPTSPWQSGSISLFDSAQQPRVQHGVVLDHQSADRRTSERR